MTHPAIHARTRPNKITYQAAGTDKAITYREPDGRGGQGCGAAARHGQGRQGF
jgi:long-chain acyl-CoA synthetase